VDYIPVWGEENMSIPRNLRILGIILVTCVCLVSLFKFTSNGYCSDDWVYVMSVEDYTIYYNSSSIKIDKQNHIIKVWVKDVLTNKGRDNLLKKSDSVIKDKNIKDFNHILRLLLLDYRDWKFSYNNITYYKKSGDVLLGRELPIEWKSIPPDSVFDYLFNKMCEDYNIKR
jgi:hypothetical protein